MFGFIHSLHKHLMDDKVIQDESFKEKSSS